MTAQQPILFMTQHIELIVIITNGRSRLDVIGLGEHSDSIVSLQGGGASTRERFDARECECVRVCAWRGFELTRD